MSFGTEVKHCEKCGNLIVRKDTEMQWFCKNCNSKKRNFKSFLDLKQKSRFVLDQHLSYSYEKINYEYK